MDKLKPRQLVYDSFFAEANRISERTDWFLIFHAILLEAFLITEKPVPQYIVAIFGVVTSFLWLATGIRTQWLAHQIGSYLQAEQFSGARFAAVWSAIYKARRKHATWQWARPIPIFLLIIPSVCMFVWVAMLFTVDSSKGVSEICLLSTVCVPPLAEIFIILGVILIACILAAKRIPEIREIPEECIKDIVDAVNKNDVQQE